MFAKKMKFSFFYKIVFSLFPKIKAKTANFWLKSGTLVKKSKTK